MRTILITESQANSLGFYLTNNFVVRRFDGYIKNSFLFESYNNNTVEYAPHKQLARMLSLGYKYVNGQKKECTKLNCSNFREVIDNSSGQGTSFYFSVPFVVDGKTYDGVLRISDHNAVQQTFLNRNIKYCLSIVFPNGTKNGSSRFDLVNIWEYVSPVIDKDKIGEELNSLTTKLLHMLNVEIRNNRVVQSSGIEFTKLDSRVSKQDEYRLFTTNKRSKTIGRNMEFAIISNDGKSVGRVIATQTKNGFKLNDEYRDMFKIGDVLTYYSFSGNNSVPQRYGQEVITY